MVDRLALFGDWFLDAVSRASFCLLLFFFVVGVGVGVGPSAGLLCLCLFSFLFFFCLGRFSSPVVVARLLLCLPLLYLPSERTASLL